MKNALLCFLKYPEPGHVKTRLARDLQDSEIGAAIYAALAERVLTEVYPLPDSYDLILYADPSHDLETYRAWIGDAWQIRFQEGDDLGDRMGNAFAATFRDGYARVAVIGTDCIGMDQQVIESVFVHLDSHDFVIGPSSDGGYYLLAGKAETPWIFEDVAWSTDAVLETTLDRIEHRGQAVFHLEERLDVDTLDDLVAFRESLPPEHYLATKIDQLVLSRMTLEGDPDEILEEL